MDRLQLLDEVRSRYSEGIELLEEIVGKEFSGVRETVNEEFPYFYTKENFFSMMRGDKELQREYTPLERSVIDFAYDLSYRFHSQTVRRTGGNGHRHPWEVGRILVDRGAKYTLVTAGLLHDWIEDQVPKFANDIEKSSFVRGKLEQLRTMLEHNHAPAEDINEIVNAVDDLTFSDKGTYEQALLRAYKQKDRKRAMNFAIVKSADNYANIQDIGEQMRVHRITHPSQVPAIEKAMKDHEITMYKRQLAVFVDAFKSESDGNTKAMKAMLQWIDERGKKERSGEILGFPDQKVLQIAYKNMLNIYLFSALLEEAGLKTEYKNENDEHRKITDNLAYRMFHENAGETINQLRLLRRNSEFPSSEREEEKEHKEIQDTLVQVALAKAEYLEGKFDKLTPKTDYHEVMGMIDEQREDERWHVQLRQTADDRAKTVNIFDDIILPYSNMINKRGENPEFTSVQKYAQACAFWKVIGKSRTMKGYRIAGLLETPARDALREEANTILKDAKNLLTRSGSLVARAYHAARAKMGRE